MIYNQEHISLMDSFKNFIQNEINPQVDQWEKEGIFPAHELFKRLAEMSLLGICRNPEFGGSGLDYSYEIAFAEACGEISCGAIPMAIGVQTNMATPALEKFGSKELKEEFLAPSLKGEKVACIGVSEPQAGSDVSAIKTYAKKDGNDYIISGTKMWITNAIQADWMCLLANTGKGNPHRNKSLFCIPMKQKGVSISPQFEKLGMQSSDTAQVFFDHVRIPSRYLIGEEGEGFKYQMVQFQEERLFAAASVLKLMENVIHQTALYNKDRKIFGKPLLSYQASAFTLCELQSEVEALRSLVYRATQEFVNGEDVTLLASMAKLKAGRLGRKVSDQCLQLWGAMGYMWESHIARAYRDLRLISIGGGADEVMLSIIGKKLFS